MLINGFRLPTRSLNVPIRNVVTTAVTALSATILDISRVLPPI